MKMRYLAPLSLLACGCLAGELSGPDEEPLDELETFATKTCDRSKYNCKLPAAPIDRNRIFNHATGSYDWPIASGAHLRDGLGNVRGVVASQAVKINYGLRKTLAGTAHVYAWAAPLSSGIAASGWVRETALVHGPISRMQTVSLPDPGSGDYDAIWTVTGGNPASFGALKVLPGYSGGGVKATDYLTRPGNVINLCYNLPGMGGVAIDTFPVNVPFRRSRGVSQLDIAIYPPGSAKAAGAMSFVYGHVGGRYGWIARDALGATGPSGTCSVRCCDDSLQVTGTPGAAACHEASKTLCAARGHVLRSRFNGVMLYRRTATCVLSGTASLPSGSGAGAPATPQTSGVCYVRCCDGLLNGPLATADGQACHQLSQGLCSAHGHVKHSTFDGATVYERPKSCYAKCHNRLAYHRLDGVTEDCTQHAKTFCAVPDRGGLQDATWSQCQP